MPLRFFGNLSPFTLQFCHPAPDPPPPAEKTLGIHPIDSSHDSTHLHTPPQDHPSSSLLQEIKSRPAQSLPMSPGNILVNPFHTLFILMEFHWIPLNCQHFLFYFKLPAFCCNWKLKRWEHLV